MDFGQLTWPLAWDIAARLGAATLMGAILALHPMRLWRLKAEEELDWELIRAQVLITVAAALMVIVIGESTARAFGLVGIGSFVRFRTVMKSPRDAAGLFVLIGIGMACGLRHFALAGVVTGFAVLLLCVLELGPVNRPKKKGDKNDKEKKDEEPPLPDDGPL
jgi:uncharacterized membrane protein YhiD involved in acid resistance